MQGHEELDFQSGIEGLFIRGLAGRITPRLQARLKEAGLDLNVPLRPAYPRLVFSRCCLLAAEELYPHLPREEGLRQLGRVQMEGYAHTLVGLATFKLLNVLGMKRTLGQLTRAFRSGDNYTQTRMTLLEEGHAELWLSQVNGQPTFSLGILETGLQAAGARGLQVRILREEGEGCVYEVRWGGEARQVATG
jgi:uncharacterized protein (TIGR02265 family)